MNAHEDPHEHLGLARIDVIGSSGEKLGVMTPAEGLHRLGHGRPGARRAAPRLSRAGMTAADVERSRDSLKGPSAINSEAPGECGA